VMEEEPEFPAPREEVGQAENEPEKAVQAPSEISRDFEEQSEEVQTYEEDPGTVGAWRTLEQRRKLVIYRKLTGHWPDEVSRETGLQSYYEIRYFSTREEHKRKYAKQHALARQWWAEYKEQTGSSETGKVGRVKPHLHLVSNE
jgi:hypothetical protein